ncbi:MAG: hypothetical protein V3T72_00045 [Thermoanaerobaculia bacterium]
MARVDERLAVALRDASLAGTGQQGYLDDVARAAAADLTVLLSELPALRYLRREPVPRIYGVLADLFLLTDRRELAAEAYRRAAGAAPENASRDSETLCGVVYDDKLYTVDLWRHRRGRPRLSHYLLVREPRTWQVQERLLLPGFPTAFRVAGDTLEILYRPSPAELRTVQLTGGRSSHPVWVPAGSGPLARLQSLDAAWTLADNFVYGDDGERSPEFQLREQARDGFAASLPELEAALGAAILEDPTQPWHLFFLGQSLWARARRPQAAVVWEELLAGDFRATPYYEWAWMAQSFELYGQPEWADAAYRRALEHRRKLPRPVGRSSALERQVNAPFVKSWSGAAHSPALDPERAYLWWLRAREISGIAEGDGFRAVLWADYFKGTGDEERAAAELAYLARVRQEPRARISAAWVDYGLWLFYASLAGLLFVPLGFLTRFVRPAFSWLFPGKVVLTRTAIPVIAAAAMAAQYFRPSPGPLPWVLGILALAPLIVAELWTVRMALLQATNFILLVWLVPLAVGFFLSSQAAHPLSFLPPLIIAPLAALGLWSFILKLNRGERRKRIFLVLRRSGIICVPLLVCVLAWIALTFAAVLTGHFVDSPAPPSDTFYVTERRLPLVVFQAPPEQLFDAALDRHASGHTEVARWLYDRLPETPRQRSHLAALDRGLPPWISEPVGRRPSLDLAAVRESWVDYQLWRPRTVLSILRFFVEDRLPAIFGDAAAQAGIIPLDPIHLGIALLAGLALAALLSTRGWLGRGCLLLIPGSFSFLGGKPLRAYLTFLFFAFAAGPSFWLLAGMSVDQPSPGLYSSEAQLPQPDEIALPPLPVDQLIAESFWSLLWVYPGAKLFYLLVALSLAAALYLHGREAGSSKAVPDDSRDWMIEVLSGASDSCRQTYF